MKIPKKKLNQARNGSITKAARMILLLEWKSLGRLKHKKALFEIKMMFPESIRPSISTLSRDMKDALKVEALLKEYRGGK